jgi:hypothetical protein
VRIRLGAKAGKHRACEREQSRAPEKASAPAPFSGLFHDFLSYSFEREQSRAAV